MSFASRFAQLEQLLGQRAVELLADAVLSVGGLHLQCVRSRVDLQPDMGGAAMRGQRTQVVVDTCELASESVDEGTPVTVDGQPYIVAGRTDIEELRQTVLDMRVR